ncbi:hypothetical protein CVT26_011976 [Gymnopilus dilepis]|uniref:Uncharacterized protein n=1 Tax=Gymnopilus dilepis TaxID=231916 RepID=A0A409VYI6_9AGAR|nr:hypothetical protein CVT26_011976 [Gymnopilus dilepis]
MMNVYLEFIYWGFLGLINLGVSLLVYYSTKLERKQKLAAEYELSTKRRPTGPSLPSSFTYLSLFTGILNFGGAFFRFRRIHFLEIPTIPWMAEFMEGVEGGSELMELLEAKWLVAMNDWTSLFLALTFLIAGCFNFATVRQLRLRDRVIQEVLLPAPASGSGSRWRFDIDEKTMKLLLEQDQIEEKTALGPIMVDEEEGRSFAVFAPLCARRVNG